MREYNAEAKRVLESYGFTIGKRDPNLNSAFDGKFMVAEEYKAGTKTRDAANGPWCIVGNDLEYLIEQAARFWCDLIPDALAEDERKGAGHGN